MEPFRKQSGSADFASGQFYEIKLTMLFLLRGTIAIAEGKIENFHLATNLEIASPFDDIVFKYSAGGCSRAIMLQVKHKKSAPKNVIDWNMLMNTKREFSIKKYLDGYLEMNHPTLEHFSNEREFVLYTNAPFKEDHKALVKESEGNSFYTTICNSVIKIMPDESVYDALKNNSEIIVLIDELKRTIQSGEFRTDRLAYQKYRNHLQDSVVGFSLTEKAKDQNLFSSDFLKESVPEDILTLRNALFDELKSKGEDDDELVTRLKKIKVQVFVNYIGPSNVKAKRSMQTTLSRRDVLDFIENFYLAHSQPGENEIEDIIKKEIASFYRISQSDADVMYANIFTRIMNWWKGDAYYLTESSGWFDMERKNLLKISLIYLSDLVKMKLKNMCIVYKSTETLEETIKWNQIVNVVCDEPVAILYRLFVYQTLERCNKFYLLLDQISFEAHINDVLEAFKNDCDILAVYSSKLIPNEFIQIIEAKEFKRIILIGSALDCSNIDMKSIKMTSILPKITFEELTCDTQNRIFEHAQILLQGNIVPLKDIVERSSLKDAITVDLLANLISEGLALIGCPLDYSGESYIPRTLRRNDKNINQEDIQPTPRNKFILISGLPGMGKSTLISSLMAKKCHWKCRINLIEHCKLLQSSRKISELEFLRRVNQMSDTEFNLFKSAYAAGKVVLFFDGFDEIAPDYKDIVLELIRSVEQGPAKEVWVTTRPPFKQELEMKLSTVAYNLKPFSHEEQIKFLTQRYGYNVSDVEDYIKKISDEIIDSYRSFTGIPLHLKMISELRKELSSKKDFNLFNLYKKFIHDKFYDVSLRDKAKIDLCIPEVKYMADMKYQNLISQHEKFALLSLFDDSDNLQLFSQKEFDETILAIEDMGRGKEKTGIIYSFVKKKPVFVHRTFAEFFAASWLAKYYLKYNTVKNFKEINIYKKIYQFEENTVLARFFDFSLSGGKTAINAILNNEVEKIKSMISENNPILEEKDLAERNVFHLAAAYEKEELFDLLKRRKLNFQDQLFKFYPMDYYRLKTFRFSIDMSSYCKYNSSERNEDLPWSCRNGDITSLQALIQNRVDLNGKDKDDLTLLHLATYFGNIEIIKYLLENNVQLNERDHNSATPLLLATLLNQREIAEILTKSNADLSPKDKHGFTPLHWVVKNFQTSLVELLISKGADLNIKNDYGNTPLHLAAEIGDSEITLFLLDQGAGPHLKNNCGDTPLIVAAKKGYSEIVKALLSHRADPNSTNRYGDTPLHLAAEIGDSEITLFLLDQGAGPHLKNNCGDTPLNVAAKKGYSEIVKALLSSGADPNVKNNNGWTPLHIAAYKGHSDIVQFLFEHGIDTNSTGNNMETPLHLAAQNGHANVVQILLQSGAKVNTVDNNGETPFNIADRSGRSEIVKILIEKGADVSSEKKDIETFYDLIEFNRDSLGRLAEMNAKPVNPSMAKRSDGCLDNAFKRKCSIDDSFVTKKGKTASQNLTDSTSSLH